MRDDDKSDNPESPPEHKEFLELLKAVGAKEGYIKKPAPEETRRWRCCWFRLPRSLIYRRRTL